MSSGAKALGLTVLLLAAVIAFLGLRDRLPDWWDDASRNGSRDEVSLTSLETLVEHGNAQGDQREVPIGTREAVRGGDTVRLGGEGEATIDYSRYVRVHLFRDTHLRALGEFNPDEPNAEMRVEQGTLVASVLTPEAAERLVIVDIESDIATIRTRGTEFFVHVEPTTGATWVIVSDGEVTVDGAGSSVALVAGTQTWVEPGEPPVGPLPASRAAVGDRFPPIGTLTGGALSDDDWLLSGPPPADEDDPVIDAFEIAPAAAAAGTPVRVSVLASDQGSGIAEIVVFVDGVVEQTCRSPSCDTVLDPRGTGDYHIDVLVRDRAGNVAEDRRSLLVDADSPVIDPPVLDPGEPTSSERVVIRAAATDPSGIAELRLVLDDQELAICASDTCAAEFGPLPAGDYELEVRARDALGNPSTRATSLTVARDDPPVAVITSPAGISELRRRPDGTFDVLLDASESFDPNGTALSYTWTVERIEDGLVSPLDSVERGTANFEADQSCGSTGTYRFTLTVIDATGMRDVDAVDISYPIVC